MRILRYTEFVVENAERQVGRMAFIGWFVHYVLVFVVLAAVAVFGVFVGKKWSDSSARKKQGEAADQK